MAASKSTEDEDTGPPNKRMKPDDKAGSEEDQEAARATILQQAWNHYRNFIDGDDDQRLISNEEDEEECPSGEGSLEHPSEEGGDAEDEEGGGGGGGDVDELLELIEILSSDATMKEVSPLTIDPSSGDSEQSKLLDNIENLLPILLSMSYLHMANDAISETMFDPNEQADDTNNDEDEQTTDNTSPEYHFGKSLHYWPTNPAAHSLFANYHRMNSLASAEDICEKYINAAEYARCWRVLALNYLQSNATEEEEEEEEEESNEEDGMSLNPKEWVELLILNGALDVDYIGGDSNDEEEDEENVTNSEANTEDYSSSEVEATASFMSAFLLSTLSKHKDALPHLKKFRLSHRIHPNVWKEAQNSSQSTKGNEKSADESSTVLFAPRMYDGTAVTSSSNGNGKLGEAGVIPPELYQRLCKILAPNAPYWNESDYDNRGYYSYFIDLDAKTNDATPSVRDRPTNVIEDVIVNHLLPLAERSMQENVETGATSTRIVGAEWWAHTRSLGANLGHQVHFDTDESLLGRENKVTHPIVSSVLYITGAGRGCKAGSTIVFDQTPESKDVAPQAWISHPKNNAFMTFPGELLHGVLPCAGTTGKKEANNGSSESKEEIPHRLTFMVGFWTRNVPEAMGERTLYSACGPLPPATPEHSWVIESQRGYDNAMQQKSKSDGNASKIEHRSNMAFDLLPSASPAWEHFDCEVKTESSNPGATLTIPKGLDHRFFVWNAPNCFSESLIEKEDCV